MHIGSLGILRMQRERNRQTQEKGYTPEHDAQHEDGELARAAACYLDWAASKLEGVDVDEPHPFWPWGEQSWNPENPMRAIEKAGAMAAAEFDRAQYVRASNGG